MNPQSKISRWAMASLVFDGIAIVSLVLASSNAWIMGVEVSTAAPGILALLPAIICGHIARGCIQRSRGALGGNNWAFGGLVTGYFLFFLLAFGIWPSYRISKTQARRAQAKQDVTSIATALAQYQKEYDKPLIVYQGREGSSRELTVGGGTAHNCLIFNTLRSLQKGLNVDDHLNPRKIVFFEGRMVLDPTHPRGGFADQAEVPEEIRGSYFDPWGHEYVIRIHYDTTKPMVAPDGTIVKGNVIVWSLGGDGISGTKTDLVSWK